MYFLEVGKLTSAREEAYPATTVYSRYSPVGVAESVFLIYLLLLIKCKFIKISISTNSATTRCQDLTTSGSFVRCAKVARVYMTFGGFGSEPHHLRRYADTRQDARSVTVWSSD